MHLPIVMQIQQIVGHFYALILDTNKWERGNDEATPRLVMVYYYAYCGLRMASSIDCRRV